MTLIDGDRIVTVQLYDDEHEEFTEKKMSIIDFVNGFSDEGVTTADDVLDNIRAEIVDLGQRTMNDNRASGIWACRDIIDKYKAERK